ncbi:MAG: pyridoxamine 5'-phosphate oxidase family protein [Campylobacteraceae bacterium]|jgi:uncharacterized pyridoxamine 5'-phosphate oxidase family protein|nr:pyridoxamine 5'-phosphate oxidase family protein [Campylobacteraceae bacterium]
MEEILEFLTKSPAFYVGTVDGEGKPRVRAFNFVMEWEGKLTFVTNITKKVYKQLENNPYVEICAFVPPIEWVRISGKVKLFQSIEANKKVFEVMPSLRDIYTDENNPILACFFLEEAQADFYSFEAGQEPYKSIQLLKDAVWTFLN